MGWLLATGGLGQFERKISRFFKLKIELLKDVHTDNCIKVFIVSDIDCFAWIFYRKVRSITFSAIYIVGLTHKADIYEIQPVHLLIMNVLNHALAMACQIFGNDCASRQAGTSSSGVN